MPGPFVKGDVRINRKGRPKKGASLTDVLSWKLGEINEAGKPGKEVIAEKLIALALDGDVNALKYVYDRIDGRPLQSVGLTTWETEKKLKELFSGN